jgi:isopenicillin-N epimerase
MQRRDFLRASSLGVAGGLLATLPAPASGTGLPQGGLPGFASSWSAVRAGRTGGGEPDWEQVRAAFAIDRSWMHMSGLFLASHPEPVATAIREFRERLDANPVHEVLDNWSEDGRTRAVIAEYIGAETAEVGLTGSTTMSLAVAIHGLRLPPASEILHTTHDHSVANRAIEFKSQHAGASVRRISLYDDDHPEKASGDEVLSRLRREIQPQTRLFMATWVHSKNGVKLPIAAMSRVIDEVNATRDEIDHVVFVVDGVHAFGIEDQAIPALGCDFFCAGTHKWIFGPRGTGMLWGHPRSHGKVTPIIPSIGGGGGWGGRMSPGGFHAFEHRWALAQAFEFHMEIGKRRVQGRIHALNRRLKEGLAEMPHVRLYTPMESALSSGLTCFDVEGFTPREAVDHLGDERRIIASTTPYSPSYARLTPGLLNDEGEIDRALAAIEAMG